MAKTNNWTRDQLIVALNLYLKLPFGKLHSRTPEIINLAKLIGRTPGSVAMRLNNFATVDPYHQQRGVKGLEGGRKQVEPIWNEFIINKDDLLFESERILAALENKSIESKFADILTGYEHLKGKTKNRIVKTRVNQNVFRQIVMANYSNTCAITGINIPDLLVASHIIPWAANENDRLNPQNGLALNGLHDRAFECGYITITPDYKIKVSSIIKNKKNSALNDFILRYENQDLISSRKIKYEPNIEFLKYHNDKRFKP